MARHSLRDLDTHRSGAAPVPIASHAYLTSRSFVRVPADSLLQSSRHALGRIVCEPANPLSRSCNGVSNAKAAKLAMLWLLNEFAH